MAGSQAPVIVWFRRDLRLSDNAALAAAAKSGAPLLPLYILDDETPAEAEVVEEPPGLGDVVRPRDAFYPAAGLAGLPPVEDDACVPL